MFATILNKKFEVVDIIDQYTSLIWTYRYRDYDDFELIVPMNSIRTIKYIVQDYYIRIDASGRVMIIEKYLLTTSIQDGHSIKIIGRGLDSIIRRRIIWNTTNLSGGFQNAVKTLITENIINPAMPQRKIDNFVFKDSTDSRITAMEYNATYENRENLGETIIEMCAEKDVGFQVILTDDHKFEFSLYKGTDHTYAQNKNPYVIFSPKYNNLINSEYLENTEDWANVCFIEGQDVENRPSGGDAPILWTTVGHEVGLNRREVYTSAGGLTSDNEDVKLTHQEKVEMMEQAGREELADCPYVKSFNGETDPFSMFQYGRDFLIGDRVQIENEWGFEGTSTISEFITCQDTNGFTQYPTFTDFEREE